MIDRLKFDRHQHFDLDPVKIAFWVSSFGAGHLESPSDHVPGLVQVHPRPLLRFRVWGQIGPVNGSIYRPNRSHRTRRREAPSLNLKRPVESARFHFLIIPENLSKFSTSPAINDSDPIPVRLSRVSNGLEGLSADVRQTSDGHRLCASLRFPPASLLLFFAFGGSLGPLRDSAPQRGFEKGPSQWSRSAA
jgi:hypothetical protein